MEHGDAPLSNNNPELLVPCPLAISHLRPDAVTLNWAPISIEDVTKSFDWGQSDLRFQYLFFGHIPNKNRDVRIVGGEEIEVHLWGNYSTRSGVANTTNIALWYTIDRGATVRMPIATMTWIR